MATSGTVGQTTINVATMIEHAFRRAGVSPAEQTVDAIIAAKQCLYLYLTQLSNFGVNLWTIEKHIVGTINNKSTYECGIGTVDLKNVLWRQVTLASGGTAASSNGGTAANAFSQNLQGGACTQTSANGNISYNFGQDVTIPNVGFMPNGNQTYTLIWEYLDFNNQWQEMLSLDTANYQAGTWYYWDIEAAPTASEFRVRETGGGILDVLQVCFNQSPQELPVARMSLDMYTNQVYKTFNGTQELQYWFNRKTQNPTIVTWPVADDDFYQLVIWKTRQIQDVGTLHNTIEVPDRWLEAVINELSCRLILEIPGADMSRYQTLEAKAKEATFNAQQEERDNSPIFIAPNIGCYTR